MEGAVETQLPSLVSPNLSDIDDEVSGMKLSNIKIIDEESLQSEDKIPKDEPHRISI